MMHGDISNKRSFVIGVRCENTLFHLKDRNLFDKIANIFSSEIKRAEVDKETLSLMNYIYYNTEMTVVLVIDSENYKGNEEYLLDFPASQHKVILKSLAEITMMLNTGELTYFLTNDSIEKSLVNSRYAMSVDDFNKVLKRRVNRFE